MVDAKTKQVLAADEIFVGMDVIIDPAEPLKATKGATENTDGSWHITESEVFVDVKSEKYAWSTTIADGWFKVQGGLPTTIEPEYGKSFAEKDARFAIARAVGDANVVKEIREKGGSFDAIVTMSEGKSAAFHCEYPGNNAAATKFDASNVTVEARDLVRAMALIGSETKCSLSNVKINGEEPEEPTTIDRRTLEVQAFPKASGSSGANEAFTFKAYFTGEATTRTRQLTTTDIEKALAAANRPVKSGGVNLAAKTAELASGATVTWASDNNVDKSGVITEVRTASSENYLVKVTTPEGTYFIQSADANETVPVKDKNIKYLIAADKGTYNVTPADGSDLVEVTKGEAKVGAAGLTADKNFKQAFILRFESGKKGDTSVWEAYAPGKATHYAQYTLYAKGAEGDATAIILPGTTGVDYGDSATVDADKQIYVQKGAIISFIGYEKTATPAYPKAGQVVTIKMNNGEVVRTGEVEKDLVNPVIEDITIGGTATTDKTATNNKVLLDFAVTDEPVKLQEKNVYLNGTPMRKTGANTWELLNVKSDTRFAVEREIGKLQAVNAANRAVLDHAGNDDMQDRYPTGTYTWNDDSDARPVVENSKDPLNVYLYTVWEVTPDGATFHASRDLNPAKDGLDTTTDGVKIDDGDTIYYKTTEPAKTIYVQAKNEGDQLWFSKDGVTGNVDGMTNYRFAGNDLSESTDAEPIWTVKVDKHIDANSLKLAFHISADADTYSSATVDEDETKVALIRVRWIGVSMSR